MRTSERGIAAIAAEESFRPSPYVDFAGIKTIGFGHVMRSDETLRVLTQDQAFELLRLDVRTAEDAVNKLVRMPLTQSQFDALVSFTFNEGGAALAMSTVLRRANAGDYAGAADALLMWDKYHEDGVLRTSETLAARRRRERAMFLSDVA